MKKLISAASSLVMAASMIGSAVPFATGAADATKGFELKVFPTKAGEIVSTNISEDAIKAGDVTIPIGVYFKEGTNDSKSVVCQWTVDSKDGDASNTNVTFKKYDPGKTYFDEAQQVTLANGNSGSSAAIIGFCGTLTSSGRFKETNAGTYSVADKQTSWGCPNAWGSSVWLSPTDGVYAWSGKTSDEFPLLVFEATFKQGTPAGTYSINFVDAEDDKKVQATMVEAAGGTRYALPQKNLDLKGIDIVIGGAASGNTTTKAPDGTTTTATTTKAPDGTTTTAVPSGNTTPGTKPTVTNPDDFPTAADYIVEGEDIKAKPGETVRVNFNVKNPGKHPSATFSVLINDFPAGMTYKLNEDDPIAAIDEEHGDKYYKLETDKEGKEITYIAFVTDSDTQDPVDVIDGNSVMALDVTIPADIADGTYYYSLKSFKVVERGQGTADDPAKVFYATIIPGSITIGDGQSATTTPPATTTTTKATTATTTASVNTTTTASVNTTTASVNTTTSGVTTTATPGTPLYGDTNCDKKVNIADVVVLNKWLNDAKSYNITDQGKLNADCCDAKGGAGLDKNDSDAIIRKIVHLVELPCASADLK
ncbi:MAG: hypothetical protein K2N27_01770 [Ruminococcus sp.]|nr:hypothetical protein [Ruminococcus sp.]